MCVEHIGVYRCEIKETTSHWKPIKRVGRNNNRINICTLFSLYKELLHYPAIMRPPTIPYFHIILVCSPFTIHAFLLMDKGNCMFSKPDPNFLDWMKIFQNLTSNFKAPGWILNKQFEMYKRTSLRTSIFQSLLYQL